MKDKGSPKGAIVTAPMMGSGGGKSGPVNMEAMHNKTPGMIHHAHHGEITNKMPLNAGGADGHSHKALSRLHPGTDGVKSAIVHADMFGGGDNGSDNC